MRELRDPELLEHYIRKYHSFVFQNCDNPLSRAVRATAPPKGEPRRFAQYRVF